MSGLHTLLKSARADIACSKKPHSKQMILKGANMMNKLISYFGTFTPGADGAVGAFQFEYLTSLGFAALVIFAGRAIVRRSHVLRKFAIPAPVISGLLFSVLIAIFKGTGILAISFDTNVSQRSAIHCWRLLVLRIQYFWQILSILSFPNKYSFVAASLTSGG